jgi:hypothetical protein
LAAEKGKEYRVTKYEVLVAVLDRLCGEAPPEWKMYHPNQGDEEAINRARSRAFIHLFLKVRFGLLTFAEREPYLTEGTQDGGVDAYFIETESRVIYFIQSKFRTTEKNFHDKAIEVEELLQMDIDRLLDGDLIDVNGVEYNSKIKQLVSKIKSLDNISRYRYEVVILANVRKIARSKLGQLTGGFNSEVFNYERCYSELLFPLVSANFYSFEDLHLALNLSNKNAGAKISYTVSTRFAKLEITVVFVPTIEIAAAMFKYRNAILKYNPRSYLEHEGSGVNAEIRSSILSRDTNEFALFNNGITVLSDATYLNERIGQKDRAQLTIVNPQIINGGQTGYTLSRIFAELSDAERQRMFEGKEVLLKIITFDTNEKLDEDKKTELIDSISRATNSQTVVSRADRRSNEDDLKRVQERAFRQFGIWLERKRGEFEDGIREGYIPRELITERNPFTRAMLVARGDLEGARSKKVFVRSDFAALATASDEEFAKCYLALEIIRRQRIVDPSSIGASPLTAVYVALLILAKGDLSAPLKGESIDACIGGVSKLWPDFRTYLKQKYSDSGDLWLLNRKAGRTFDLSKYFRSQNVVDDVGSFFLPRMKEVLDE